MSLLPFFKLFLLVHFAYVFNVFFCVTVGDLQLMLLQ